MLIFTSFCLLFCSWYSGLFSVLYIDFIIVLCLCPSVLTTILLLSLCGLFSLVLLLLWLHFLVYLWFSLMMIWLGNLDLLLKLSGASGTGATQCENLLIFLLERLLKSCFLQTQSICIFIFLYFCL
jgi:hypothetical protein